VHIPEHEGSFILQLSVLSVASDKAMMSLFGEKGKLCLYPGT